MKKVLLILFIALAIACGSKKETQQTSLTVSVEKLDPALNAIVGNQLTVSVIASGYEWTEGALWLEGDKKLLFSDVPTNTIYQWTEEKGSSIYLTPSGYTGEAPRGGEPGSNGLTLDVEGNLLLCQHGDRRIAMMNTSLAEPASDFTTISDTYNGKRFNSPNDLVFHNYDIYFTDPAYGLEKQMDDPKKELPFQGMYRIPAEGQVQLMIDSLTRPNGIGFSPNGKKMYVANSDSEKARWYEYSINDSLKITSGKIVWDATEQAKTEKGLPDGLKVDAQGNIFATGPGGIWIFSGDGKLLGKIKLEEATSNCALTADGKTLFVTNDMLVLKIKLRD
ncbi:MAG: SMP-30/gluconolactonase/LRE family protein [Chryseotalea sp. WA131a]|nr:MAG: SMP-30/gluconolactonase/LRE family protein [Chryseotalea sp. WA131a]